MIEYYLTNLELLRDRLGIRDLLLTTFDCEVVGATTMINSCKSLRISFHYKSLR